MTADEAAPPCGWRVGPIPKLDGQVSICVLPRGHEMPHVDEWGGWFEGCGRPPGSPHPREMEMIA